MPHIGLIRLWALLAVAVTSAFLMWIGNRLINLLSTTGWCDRAVGAATAADGRPEYAVGGCFNLLNAQVDYLGLSLLIAQGTLGLCLLTLVVIVLAGGRLNVKVNKDGIEGNISPDAAAQEVADAAQNEADLIKGE